MEQWTNNPKTLARIRAAKTRQAAWDVGRMKTLSCRATVDEWHDFHALCKRNGITAHAVLLGTVRRCLDRQSPWA